MATIPLQRRWMALTLTALLAACGPRPEPLSDAAQTAPQHCGVTPDLQAVPSNTRVVFLLDTSGSMSGLGDGKADIFDEVKAKMLQFVAETQPGSLELFTFDRGLREHRSYLLPADNERWNSDMAALRADGNNTYLYRSMEKALGRLGEAPSLATNVYVITDGVDNDPSGRYSASEALAAYSNRSPFDRLMYIALGSGIPNDAEVALKNSSYATGISAQVGEVPTLARLGAEVRTLHWPVIALAPEGARLSIGNNASAEKAGFALQNERIENGIVAFKTKHALAEDAVSVLCIGEGEATARPVVMRLRLPEAGALGLINRGASRNIGGKKSLNLHYRLGEGARVAGESLSDAAFLLPAGVEGRFARLPVAGFATVHLKNTTAEAHDLTMARLRLPDGRQLPLFPEALERPLVALNAPRAPQGEVLAPGGEFVGPTLPPTETETASADGGGAGLGWWWLLLPLALAGVGAWWFFKKKQSTAAPRFRAPPRPTSPEGKAMAAAAEKEFEARMAASLPEAPAPDVAAEPKDAPESAPDPTPPAEEAAPQLDIDLTAPAPAPDPDPDLPPAEGAPEVPEPSVPPVPTAVELPYSLAATPSAMSDAAPLRRVTETQAQKKEGFDAGATPTEGSTVVGLEVGAEGGVLRLLTSDANNAVIVLPERGTFDVGLLGATPLLSGLRMEVVDEGLRLLQLPTDLEVSQGARLLTEGDVLRHGAMFGFEMAASARRWAPPMGSWSDLGLPLKLSSFGSTVHAVGRYGEHRLNLPEDGLVDLGQEGEVPALSGLMLMVMTGRVLVAAVPRGVELRSPEGTVTAGSFLPQNTELHFTEYEDEGER